MDMAAEKPGRQRLYSIFNPLQPKALRIDDLSGYYRMRHLLGPRKHMAHLVKNLEDNKGYSASIFDCSPPSSRRPSQGTQQTKVYKRNLGSFSTLAQAHNACSKARMKRDMARNGNSAPTHFKILLVSECFACKSHTERINQVYQLIVNEFCVELAKRDLMPFQIILDLCDPYQHAIRSAAVTPDAYGINESREVLSELQIHKSEKDLYLLMREYQINCKLAKGDNSIVKRSFINNKVRRSGQMSAQSHFASPFRKKGTGVIGRKDTLHNKVQSTGFTDAMSATSFNDLHQELTTKHALHLHKLTTCAVWMQRMIRLRHIPRLQAKYRAATQIQRSFRGHCGRKSASAWRRSRDQSVQFLQRTLRGARGRHRASERRIMISKLALSAQAIARGFLIRRYMRWALDDDNCDSAILIQKVSRAFLGRCIVRKAIQKAAATKIQKIARMFIAKRRLRAELGRIYYCTVLIPSAIQIQSAWRCFLAVSIARQRKRLYNAATEIQSRARGVSSRQFIRAIRYNLLQQSCAELIQKNIRRCLARLMAAKMRQRHYFLHTVSPSATKIQNQYRSFYKKRRQQSATTIQRAFCNARAIHLTKAKWMDYCNEMKERAALRIQTTFRVFWARSRYIHALDLERARRLIASRIIVNASRRHKIAVNNRIEKEFFQREQSMRAVAALRSEQERIRSEVQMTPGLIERCNNEVLQAENKVRTLKVKMKITARIGEVETDSDGADFALHQLDNELYHLNIDLEECRDTIKFSKSEAKRLQLKQIDYKAALERLHSLEKEELERRAFLEHRRSLAREEKEREERIRRERIKWKVKLPSTSTKRADAGIDKPSSTIEVKRKEKADVEGSAHKLYDKIIANCLSILNSNGMIL